MTEAEKPTTGAEKAGWTQEERDELLYRVFLQFKDGRAVNWGKVDMPGRNRKSITCMWTKINKPILELESRIGAPPSPTTPDSAKRKPLPMKRKATEIASDDGNDEETVTPTKKPAQKRGRKPAAKKAKAKPEPSDNDLSDLKTEPNLDEYPDDGGF